MNHQKSIAVLPFVNLSNNIENEYFCDGITEEIINALTNVNGLKVIARTSSFAFKGKEQNWVYETKGMEYGFGMRKVSINELTNTESDLQLIGHTGSTASFLWY